MRLLSDGCVPEAPKGLRPVLAAGRYRPTHELGSLGDAEVILICVPTPLDGEGRADPSAVLEVAGLLRELAPRDALVVLESTVAPGFVEGGASHPGAASGAWP